LRQVSEVDLELLDGYLDDTLSPGQVQHVSQRLAAEPELAAAMHELRALRTLRLAAWRSMEPSDAWATRVARRVNAVTGRERRQRILRRTVRFATATAAAVSVFVAGWFLRSPASPGVLAREAPRDMQPMQHSSAGAYQVTVIDGTGRALPVQSFSALDEARQFAQDVVQFEARRQEARQGETKLVSERF